MSNVQPLAELAASQYGIISLHQLRLLGYSHQQHRGLLANGVLIPSFPRAFTIAGSPNSWRQRLMAACLSGGPGAVAGHRSAAALWALDGFRPGVLEISVHTWERRRMPGVTVHESDVLCSRDRTTVHGIPVTTPVFTLLEVARHLNDSRLGALVDDAAKRGLITYEHLAQRHGEVARRGRDGSARMRRVLEVRPGGTVVPGSPFEVRVERLLVGAGLPAPVRQHPLACGSRPYVVDLAWPGARVAVECDGWRHHASPSDQTRDSERRNDIESHGWKVVNATWGMLRDRPWTIVEPVRRHLAGS